MLFEFNFFWKLMSLILLSWIFYGVWGFEFTTVTILTVILALQFKKRDIFKT